MEQRHQKLLDFIQDKQSGLEERLEAARLITHDVSLINISGDDVTRIYRAMVQFWKSRELYSAIEWIQACFCKDRDWPLTLCISPTAYRKVKSFFVTTPK